MSDTVRWYAEYYYIPGLEMVGGVWNGQTWVRNSRASIIAWQAGIYLVYKGLYRSNDNGLLRDSGRAWSEEK